MICFLAYPVLSNAATLSIGNDSGFSGDQVEIPISIQSSSEDPSDVDFTIIFDSEKITVANVLLGEAGQIAKKGNPEYKVNNDNELTVLVTTLQPTIIPNGELVIIVFQIKSEASLGKSDLIFKKANVSRPLHFLDR